jgi:D-glucosaminate-6-phosphate ammonia-lyase
MTFPKMNSSRRQMFQGLGTGFLAGIFSRVPLNASPKVDSNIYEAIGVRPLINCKGTYTIISASQTLPEVKKAMDEASRHYVHLDELMEAVGRRLAELTKAESGIVTAGCAAALTHSTSACIAGANPEKMQRLPNLTGLRAEVVMPRQSRNVYDHAIRAVGVKMVTPSTREEFLESLRPSTAMVALLGEAMSKHPMSLPEISEAAHKRGIPVLVDAAAERLSVPNVYLSQGADLVAYSGGKCLRGPQCAGLLLGRKDLVQAAWINSAPHHAVGRAMKVGKEEIMGMLAAVEAWVRRDHDAEWKQWESWLATIRDRVSSVPSVRTEVQQPSGPSNYAPILRISWSAEKLGMNGDEMLAALLSGNPRVIVTPGGGRNSGEAFITVMPYMMMPGDDRIAAARIYEVLSNPPRREKSPARSSDVKMSGRWDVHIAFARGEAAHKLFLEQSAGKLMGTHEGEFLSGDVTGNVDGDHAKFRSSHHYEGTSIDYDFDGVVSGGAMRGTVNLGEYGKADFTAQRHWRA